MLSHPHPGPAEVYAALWLGALLVASGALLVASGELRDPFPADLEELSGRYFATFPPDAKA